MKLCPQCDFIYEDDQSVCDMDGKELVPDPAMLRSGQGFASPVSAAPVLHSEVLAVESAERRRRNFAFLTAVGLVLAALVIVIYLARMHQLSSSRAPEIPESSTDRSAGEISPQLTSAGPAAPVSTETSPASSEQSREHSDALSAAETDQAALSSSDSSLQSGTSKESLAHTRLTPGPVSAGAPSGISRGPVIVRLTNGASIRADEAWEKSEGIWYRQAGVVTFLRRSQVRTIERLPSPTLRSKSTANDAAERNRQTVVAADTKKDSRVTSFLKKTGRILKKPFKF